MNLLTGAGLGGLDPAATRAAGSGVDADRRVCSAKGCRADAEHAVVWRNPKLHVEGRRKVWLACGEHRASLADFVSARGFLIEVVGVDALTAADG
ncbi:hypothetical protein [Terracoccus luteus]|uniref:Acetone carboxylase n=1 Tax=Terracoccus luteus TaxID=53356 RepID=A0A495XYZ6_9MICO|nr:hypothetical protein [Terracoccus luteus]MBB2987706.1 hypothetical protein [Terracoccus luteus]MCP2173357.1 hypothetical protein [Terracoccus luteus]RKT78094.1 hypothetical protein DFJ68_1530 [Terracoccus luteus]